VIYFQNSGDVVEFIKATLIVVVLHEGVETVRERNGAFHRSIAPSTGVRSNLIDEVANTSESSPAPVLIMSFLSLDETRLLQTSPNFVLASVPPTTQLMKNRAWLSSSAITVIISLVQFPKHEKITPRIFASDDHEGEAFVVRPMQIASLDAGYWSRYTEETRVFCRKAFQRPLLAMEVQKGMSLSIKPRL
jgi:hypothetical protein